MKIKKIILGLLSIILFSNYFATTNAEKVEGIVWHQQRIRDDILPNAPIDPCKYIAREADVFDTLLRNCVVNKFLLVGRDRGYLLQYVGAFIDRNPYIVKKHGRSMRFKLNCLDTDAINQVSNYDELINNLAVMYLVYSEFYKLEEYDKECDSLGLIQPQSQEEVARKLEKKEEEQIKIDEQRVKDEIERRFSIDYRCP